MSRRDDDPSEPLPPGAAERQVELLRRLYRPQRPDERDRAFLDLTTEGQGAILLPDGEKAA